MIAFYLVLKSMIKLVSMVFSFIGISGISREACMLLWSFHHDLVFEEVLLRKLSCVEKIGINIFVT